MPAPSIPAPSDLARQFDDFAATWDAEHGPVSPRAPEFAARIFYLRALCRALGRPKMLDLGCATGWTLLHLFDVIDAGLGIDIAPAMIERARRNAGPSPIHFQVGDAAEFCAGCPERYGLVLLAGVLAHLPDPGTTLAGIKRVLTDEGRLVVITPHPWGPAFCLKRLLNGNGDAPPALHLSPLAMRALALRHGLELTALRGLPYAPWPVLRVLFGDGGTPVGMPRRNPLAGVIRGAFAAEFRHSPSHRSRADRQPDAGGNGGRAA